MCLPRNAAPRSRNRSSHRNCAGAGVGRDSDAQRDPQPSCVRVCADSVGAIGEHRRARPDRAPVHRRDREVPELPHPDGRGAARARRPRVMRHARACGLEPLPRNRAGDGKRTRFTRLARCRARGSIARRAAAVPRARRRLYHPPSYEYAIPRRVRDSEPQPRRSGAAPRDRKHGR